MSKTYKEKKEEARQLAIDYGIMLESLDISWGELSEAQEYFENLGKRYGLTKEFRENGIC